MTSVVVVQSLSGRVCQLNHVGGFQQHVVDGDIVGKETADIADGVAFDEGSWNVKLEQGEGGLLLVVVILGYAMLALDLVAACFLLVVADLVAKAYEVPVQTLVFQSLSDFAMYLKDLVVYSMQMKYNRQIQELPPAFLFQESLEISS